MGYVRHHAIIVTSWNCELLWEAFEKAKSIFPELSSMIESEINRYTSFFIPPDGSKEGWDKSDEGDSRRKDFINWLNKQRYEDGSTALDWLEVQYGDDEGESKVIRHSDEVDESRVAVQREVTRKGTVNLAL